MAWRDGREERPLEEQVEDFLVDRGIDESAAAKFRAAPESVIREVLSSGMKQDVRNPSSLLMSMIRAARQVVEGNRHKLRREIDGFVSEHRLDDRCQDALHRASDEDFEFIMKEGPLTARNPSSAILTLLKHNLRQFIVDAQLDQSAQDSLCSQNDSMISAVLDEAGGIVKARNPSSMLMKRFKELREQGVGKGDSGRDGGSRRSPLPRRGRDRFKDIDRFVRDHNIDEDAEGMLRNQSDDVIDAILSESDRFATARNVSAAVIARGKQLRAEGKGKGGSGEPRHRDSGGRDDRGDRRGEERRDDRHSDRNGSERWNDRGGDRDRHHSDRDSRWEERERREYQSDRGGDRHWEDRASDNNDERVSSRSAPMPSTTPGGDVDIDTFLARDSVDQKAEDLLRAQSEEVIAKIVGNGPLVGRNPSALLISRIRKWGTFDVKIDSQLAQEESGSLDHGRGSGVAVGNGSAEAPWRSARGYREVPPETEAPEEHAEPAPEEDADVLPYGGADREGADTRGDAEKEMTEALEDVQAMAWDQALSHEDFEVTMQRVRQARERLFQSEHVEVDPALGVDGAGLGRPSEADAAMEDIETMAEEEPPPKRPRPATPPKRPRPSAPRPSSAASVV